jgi:dihydrofolate synthase / folylpolyglutamate synthase
LGTSFRGLDAALEWLSGHVDYERTAPTRRDLPTLAPVADALGALGDPQADVACIHVTGTNGKGSTTAMAAALLEATGRRVGTYTSPDLHAVNERICLGGVPIDDAALTALLGRLAALEAATDLRLTRFDLLTVGALLHFADEAVDAAVVEVGLGGTWDATNVVEGRVAVVTNVSLDHTEVLGDTVEAIARDKAGIVKPGAIVVLGDEDPATLELQAGIARERGARDVWRRGAELSLVRNELAVGGRLVTLATPLGAHEDVFVSLHGRHQGANALCAIAAAEAFGAVGLGDEVVTGALGAIRVPGRLEVVGVRPTVLLDSAHNPAGAAVLADALEESFVVAGTRRVVVGMLTGRDPAALLAPLATVGVDVVYCCEPPSPRALSAAAVADAARRLGMDAHLWEDPPRALDAALADASDDDLVVVTGSFYVVGAVRGHVLGLGPHRG